MWALVIIFQNVRCCSGTLLDLVSRCCYYVSGDLEKKFLKTTVSFSFEASWDVFFLLLPYRKKKMVKISTEWPEFESLTSGTFPDKSFIEHPTPLNSFLNLKQPMRRESLTCITRTARCTQMGMHAIVIMQLDTWTMDEPNSELTSMTESRTHH